MSAIGRCLPYTPLALPGFSSLRSFHTLNRYSTIVLEAAMLTTGTTPPSVTLSGTPTGLFDIRIEITTSGGRGTAVFRWSSNGGGSWTSGVLTAETVLLGATGVTANFSGTGSYATDNVYRSTVKQWTDSSANGVLFEETVGPANQPVIDLTGLNGRPGLLFDGVNNRLKCFDSAFATALAGGSDTPFVAGMVAKCVGAASGNHPFFAISYDALGTAQCSFRALTSAWAAIKRGDSDASDTRSGGTADSNAHRFIYRHNGTTVDLFVDNVAVISAAAQDRDTCTVASVTLGALLSIANVFGNVIIGDVVTYTGARSATEIGYLDQWLKNDYGL